MKRTRWLGIALIAALAAATCAPGEARNPDDLGRGSVQSELKITKVVLYQSGVGYFERRGRIHSNVLTLRIRPDQVMDVLKSLTVVDQRFAIPGCVDGAQYEKVLRTALVAGGSQASSRIDATIRTGLTQEFQPELCKTQPLATTSTP